MNDKVNPWESKGEGIARRGGEETDLVFPPTKDPFAVFAEGDDLFDEEEELLAEGDTSVELFARGLEKFSQEEVAAEDDWLIEEDEEVGSDIDLFADENFENDIELRSGGRGLDVIDDIFAEEESEKPSRRSAPEASEANTPNLWEAASSSLLDDDHSAMEETDTGAWTQEEEDTPVRGFSYREDENEWLTAGTDIVNRYVNQEDFFKTVESLLSLAMSGDVEIQDTISRFVLTRDPVLDAEQRKTYEDLLLRHMPRNNIYIPNVADQGAIIDMAYDELLGIGPIGPLWRDEEVVDILINGPEHVTVERNGRLIRTPVRFKDLKHLQSTARRLSTLVDDRAVSNNNPIVTVQLPGARVQLVWEPIAVEGASVVIRKHRAQMSLDALTRGGALTAEMVAFLADAVVSRATILVSGSTGSGKTTYLNVLSGFIPRTERVIVIEDARELHLENSEVEYMLTKQAATVDDTVELGFDRLLRASLRMRPDRIVVGEILGAAGAEAMLEAAFTGHDGTMTTLHANNPEDALVRIAGLLRQATGMPEDLSRKQVNQTFDLVLQVARDPSSVRLVTHISAVYPDGSVDDIFKGTVDRNGKTQFTRVTPLNPSCPLAIRMLASGVDVTPWESI